MKKKKKLIKEEMRIDEIVRNHPQAADVFMNYGLHCVGCSLAGYESIKQGGLAHGMDKKTIRNMIKEANEYVINSSDEDKEDKNPIKITKRAAIQVAKLMKESSSSYLRIALVKMNFGHRYGFRFENKKKKDDITFDKNKTSFLVNKKDLVKLRGSTMDYLSYLPGNGFKIYSKISKRIK